MTSSATVNNFPSKSNMAAILNLMITETSNENYIVTIVLSMVENPQLDILHGHSNRFIWHWLICPDSPQNWSYWPIYRAKMTHMGIFLHSVTFVSTNLVVIGTLGTITILSSKGCSGTPPTYLTRKTTCQKFLFARDDIIFDNQSENISLMSILYEWITPEFITILQRFKLNCDCLWLSKLHFSNDSRELFIGQKAEWEFTLSISTSTNRQLTPPQYPNKIK